MRIVSLVPSITELLYDLNLDEEVVGITKFCVRPESWFRTKTRVGGTKKVHREKVLSLSPDLILANKEENTQEDIEFLQQQVQVYLSDIKTIPDALQMILDVGKLTNRMAQAEVLSRSIQESFLSFKPSVQKTALYFIWQKPYMVAGCDTFIHHMMELAGYDNLCHSHRYPELTFEAIHSLSPEVILLSSEPFPFKENHLDQFQELFPTSSVILVDGEIFSWYGSRMLHAIPYFRGLNEE